MQDPISGQAFGKYHLTSRLAFGGMAEVFVANVLGEAGFSKPVVIKRLHPRLSQDHEFVKMLIDEARLTAQLNHPNVCQVLDLGAVDGSYFIAMEYIEGEDLRTVEDDFIRRTSRVPSQAAAYIVSEALAGLNHAHSRSGRDGRALKIVHRDISPQNLLISYEGEVKIIDFGVAKARMRLVQTQAGVIKGKFRYMSPEQASGLAVDLRSDIFAAGIVLYELLRGRPHLTDVPDTEVLRRIREADLEPLENVRPDLPTSLLEIVRKALALRPRHRFQSADVFRQALISYMREQGSLFGRNELAQLMRDNFSTKKRGRGGEVPLPARVAGGKTPRAQGAVKSAQNEAAAADKRPNAAAVANAPQPVFDKRDPRAATALMVDSGPVLSPCPTPSEVAGVSELTRLRAAEREIGREQQAAVEPPAALAPTHQKSAEIGHSVSLHTANSSAMHNPEPSIRLESTALEPLDDLPPVPRRGRERPRVRPRVTGALRWSVHHTVAGRAVAARNEAAAAEEVVATDDRPTVCDVPRAADEVVKGSRGAAPAVSAPTKAGSVGARRLITSLGVLAAGALLVGVAQQTGGLTWVGGQLASFLGDEPLTSSAPSDRPAPRLARVYVESTPTGAAISACGQPTGRVTPNTVTVPAQRECLIEVSKHGRSVRRTVTAAAEQEVSVKLTLPRAARAAGAGAGPARIALAPNHGWLEVVSVRPGTVLIDGKVRGEINPRGRFALKRGVYRVQISYGNLGRVSRVKSARVVRGKSVRVNLRPQQ